MGPAGARATGHGGEISPAAGQGVKQRHALGAAGQAIAGALDISSANDLAGGGDQRGADLEFGVGGDRAQARLGGGFD
jgi:hypothetical protein